MATDEDDDQLRVGNPERERAIALLNDALGDGYLDLTEFEERASVVYAARTRGELRAVLAHLPGSERLLPTRQVSSDPVTNPAAALELDASWTTVSRKGSWQVPPRLLVTGSMGTVDLDFSRAQFSQGEVDIDLQVSASTVKVKLGADQSFVAGDVVCGSWCSVKDKTGPPSISTGPVVRLRGSLSGWSTAVVKRV
ncbi:MAG: DUF1707 domain-containing protein [Nakamurella sp.]